MAKKKRKLAMMLMLGATIVVAGHGSNNRGVTSSRRFLAMAGNSDRSLITIVARQDLLDRVAVPLTAGTRIRIIGTPQGRTIKANRIDVLN